MSMDEEVAPACGELVACDALVGLPRVPMERELKPGLGDLEAEMARLNVGKAIVRSRACLEVDPYLGNDALMEGTRGNPRLIPAWFVTPDGRWPDFDPEALVARMLAAGVRVAWTDPVVGGFSLEPWCSGALLAALQERNVPLLLCHKVIGADGLHRLLEAFPRLRVVLLEVPRFGRDRLLDPLLKLHPELCLCFGPSFSVHEGFLDLCRRHGGHRWVWGSGYPSAEGGAAITGLTYSGLGQADMAAVANGNIERLLSEVRP